MKIVVFGATGNTGRAFVEQALAKGHEVTAFVRNADALALRHEHLRSSARVGLLAAAGGVRPERMLEMIIARVETVVPDTGSST